MINLIKNKWLVLISLILLVFIIYYPSLKNDYVWDDVIIFVDRSFWHSDHNFWYMISQPVLDGTSYFRPLVFATFVAEFKLWGLKPFISHFINICILSIHSISHFIWTHIKPLNFIHLHEKLFCPYAHAFSWTNFLSLSISKKGCA